MNFDAIVIGAGSGLRISYYLAAAGKKVAIIEKGPFGGTCLNRGCIPSKMLIHGADIMEEIRNSAEFGINASVKGFNWSTLQKRTWSHIDPSAKGIEKGNKSDKNITVYKGTGKFVGKKKVEVNGRVINGRQIFICAGTRPRIPRIPGLDTVKYWTSKEALRAKKLPGHLIVIGGGYIAAELGHLYASLGSTVTMLYRGSHVLKREDQEISEAFTKIVQKKYNVELHATPNTVSKKGKKILVHFEKNGTKKKVVGDALLVATGRISNADTLGVEKTGVKLDTKGYIQTNLFMETNVPGIWAIGDIAGKYFFKHSANAEASVAVFNALKKKKMKVNYNAMPHAVFTSPQIAGVGMTEQELIAKKVEYRVGRYNYKNTGMGMAINDQTGFVKVYVHPTSKKILGCHIMGSDASTLIHQVIVAMRHGITADKMENTIHIHPALSEVVERAFLNVEY